MLCVRCGTNNPKGPCGRNDCPMLLLYGAVKRVAIEGKEEYSGKAPGVFVGRKGYPNVRAGFLSNEFATDEHDNPRLWASQNKSISDVLDFRGSLVHSRFPIHVKSFSNRLAEMTKEIAMAAKPVDVEVKLEKKPTWRLNLFTDAAPFGPSVPLKAARITENPFVPRQVERMVDDDLPAREAVTSLYKKEIDEHVLSKLISVGALGQKHNRKLVPTRWSITAVDDMLGKNLIKSIKDHQETGFSAFFGGFMGNYYIILLFPDVWSYELFESMVPPRYAPMTDYEDYSGRKDYAENTVGGYYAARLAILERLDAMKRQASVLALRFTTEEYYAPLGVWVVRSATRNAMNAKPILFSSLEEMLDHARRFLRDRFRCDADSLLSESILLKKFRGQKKLTSFIS